MKKFTTKDLINSGVFSALILITYLIAGAIFHVPFLMPLMPCMCAITAATAYMLYTTKIKRFGMLTITMVIFIIFFSATGHGLFMIPGAVVSVAIAEYILYKGNYKSIKHARLSYVSFNFFGGFMFLPIFIAKDMMRQRLVNAGRSAEYIEKYFSYFPNWLLPVIIILALLGAYIGATIAIKILNKHFKKAGII